MSKQSMDVGWLTREIGEYLWKNRDEENRIPYTKYAADESTEPDAMGWWPAGVWLCLIPDGVPPMEIRLPDAARWWGDLDEWITVPGLVSPIPNESAEYVDYMRVTPLVAAVDLVKEGDLDVAAWLAALE